MPLDVVYVGGQNGAQSHVGKSLSDTAVSSSAKRQVWGRNTLCDFAKTVVDSVALRHRGGPVVVPSVGVEGICFREPSFRGSGVTRRNQHMVALWNHVAGVGHHQVVLDFSKDRVQRHVETQGFLDGLVDQVHFLQIFVRQVGDLAALFGQHAEHLVVQFFSELWLFGQVQQEPRRCGGRRVSTAHQNTNQQVGNLSVGHFHAVLVGGVEHERVDQVSVWHDVARLSSVVNQRHVCGRDLSSRLVSASVGGQGQVGENEVDGREALVQVRVQSRERRVETGSHVVTHQRLGRGQNGQFRSGFHHVGHAAVALGHAEVQARLEVVKDLLSDARNVLSERVLGQGKLGKLLLLHQPVVGAVVDHTFAEHRRGQVAVGLFGGNVRKLRVQHKLMALWAQVHRHHTAQQHEGKHIAVFLSAALEKLVRSHTIGNGRAEPRNPVENHWYPVFSQRIHKSPQHIEHDGREHQKRDFGQKSKQTKSRVAPSDVLCQSHSGYWKRFFFCRLTNVIYTVGKAIRWCTGVRASGAMIEMPIDSVGEREAGKKREKGETGQKRVNDISVCGACSVLPPLAPFVFMPSYERIARDVVYCT
ncbi:hypothetical protein CLUG_04931 [Clavispora lusitaniae ATCC 42720]|uniref:Uncharacterized protein n=1 Tax=Clavispora lusitaniae (strain ATCC 42720) TaxID=306902 RepID=C4Y9P1_CLAL4|nr:uncharacterized protein CLUG_04931 [Clavispora lusitaniae ATCC 42720]EEQ40804.1 hypothetical protein CLUG_04931 [Clavispora lusitaniae ATCC 42720]